MPNYAYQCKAGHQQDIQATFGKAPKRVACLKCSEWAPRQITVPAVQFKGSGFTRTHA